MKSCSLPRYVLKEEWLNCGVKESLFTRAACISVDKTQNVESKINCSMIVTLCMQSNTMYFNGNICIKTCMGIINTEFKITETSGKERGM